MEGERGVQPDLARRRTLDDRGRELVDDRAPLEDDPRVRQKELDVAAAADRARALVEVRRVLGDALGDRSIRDDVVEEHIGRERPDLGGDLGGAGLAREP